MKYDLIEKKDELALALEKDELSSMIKPLIQEIHLFDTFIAGTSHIEDQSLYEALTIGETLILIREENKYDENAIMIKNKDSIKLGYIPQKDNIIFSRLLDAGKHLMAKVNKISLKNDYYRISIGIYLVDF